VRRAGNTECGKTNKNNENRMIDASASGVCVCVVWVGREVSE